MPEEIKTTTWWRVDGLLGVPKVEPVQVARETEKTITVVRTGSTGEPLYHRGRLLMDRYDKQSQLAHHFAHESEAYLFAYERAEHRQDQLRRNLEKADAAVAEFAGHVRRLGAR